MQLTEKELKVLELRKKEMTQVEIARSLKISQAAVSSFESNAKKKIEDAKLTLKLIKELGILSVMLVLIALSVAAADPGHAATVIGPGEFESGEYSLPGNLTVTQNLTVGITLYIDPWNNFMGIGTLSPSSLLHVFSGDVNFSNGNIQGFYYQNSTGFVGIGTSNPTKTLTVEGDLNVTGTIDPINITLSPRVNEKAIIVLSPSGDEVFSVSDTGKLNVSESAGDVSLGNAFFIENATGRV